MWERGFIDKTNFSEYKLHAEDDNGRMIPEFLLLHIMENCTGFLNKISQLDYFGNFLSFWVLVATKYHSKYAGKGVE